ncbi:hypothetical protein L2E82_36239 [Cichorium intybus]|uniref:Uncharacterized protein n=1 Tax=Cichorium intybus TaxID=13427 RepID=A0ACB9BQZ8_CICIN|nr:hypothetical protein L2E82_36239 [Cichorium intybus]
MSLLVLGRGTKLLELLDGETLVFDADYEVAVQEPFFDGFYSFFFLCTADCRADCQVDSVGFTVGCGGGKNWKRVVELGFQGYNGRTMKIVVETWRKREMFFIMQVEVRVILEATPSKLHGMLSSFRAIWKQRDASHATFI